jgi:hypothetical protein
MSVKAMTPVWDLPLSATEKLVLLKFAWHAHDDGSMAYPSIGAVAKMAAITERHAKRVVRALIDKKVLVVQENSGHYRATTYRLDIASFAAISISPPPRLEGPSATSPEPASWVTSTSPMTGAMGDTSVTPRVTSEEAMGDTHVLPWVTPMSPQPYMNRTEPRERDRAREEQQKSDVNHTSVSGRSNGSVSRAHASHAFCDATHSRCVPKQLHEKFVDLLAPKYRSNLGDVEARQLAEAELIAWYRTVVAGLPANLIMGSDAFKFWPDRFDARFASKDVSGRSGATSRPIPSAQQTADHIAAERRHVDGLLSARSAKRGA